MDMNRRSFLKLPALLPLVSFDPAFRSEEHHFGYESVLGTSLDLVVRASSSSIADLARQTVLEEIDRLSSILNTRDPASEISLLENSKLGRSPSRELQEVLDAYAYWEHRTDGLFAIRPGGAATPRNVDALGKAYIIDRAVEAVRHACPSVDAVLLNIGGDIVAWGQACEIDVANPRAWYDNAPPLTTIVLENAAVATSGSYARGAHLTDARNGRSLHTGIAATVVARDAVTANALATTLCLTEAEHGIQLVKATRGAEALRVASGVLHRTAGFGFLEQAVPAQVPAVTNWPPDYQLTVTLPLKTTRSKDRPYVVAWVEDSTGKLVRVLAFWGSNSKYYATLSTFWDHLKGNLKRFRSVTRATRPPGRYELVWDGLDEEHKPVPPGTYRITIESNQEHGTYARQTGSITLGESPTTITLPATANFEAVTVQYGPKSKL
jgi:thiamine biosynthesis lipoprotein